MSQTGYSDILISEITNFISKNFSECKKQSNEWSWELRSEFYRLCKLKEIDTATGGEDANPVLWNLVIAESIETARGQNKVDHLTDVQSSKQACDALALFGVFPAGCHVIKITTEIAESSKNAFADLLKPIAIERDRIVSAIDDYENYKSQIWQAFRLLTETYNEFGFTLPKNFADLPAQEAVLPVIAEKLNARLLPGDIPSKYQYDNGLIHGYNILNNDIMIANEAVDDAKNTIKALEKFEHAEKQYSSAIDEALSKIVAIAPNATREGLLSESENVLKDTIKIAWDIVFSKTKLSIDMPYESIPEDFLPKEAEEFRKWLKVMNNEEYQELHSGLWKKTSEIRKRIYWLDDWSLKDDDGNATCYQSIIEKELGKDCKLGADRFAFLDEYMDFKKKKSLFLRGATYKKCKDELKKSCIAYNLKPCKTWKEFQSAALKPYKDFNETIEKPCEDAMKAYYRAAGDACTILRRIESELHDALNAYKGSLSTKNTNIGNESKALETAESHLAELNGISERIMQKWNVNSLTTAVREYRRTNNALTQVNELLRENCAVKPQGYTWQELEEKKVESIAAIKRMTRACGNAPIKRSWML